jgi:phosphohistidine phosphatase
VLIRHAQAAGGPVDADRALTDHGARRAAAIGVWLEQAGVAPDRALVSPARRAVQTWERAGRGPVPVVDPRIYDNTVESLLTAVRDTPDDVRELLLVGHNPSIGGLTAALDDGAGAPAARRDVGLGFPTGGVAVFAPSSSFGELAPGTARLDAFAVPGD